VKALIVEDTPDIQDLLRTMLEGLGFQTEGAPHGAAALEVLRSRGPFDLCTVDILMPVMDGFSLVQAIRKEKTWDKMKILMVSTEVEKGSVDRALRLGADDYLFKPFMRDMVEGKLRLMGVLR
jgi:two-component system, chemotaxis family, chemotaxis protein CheY